MNQKEFTKDLKEIKKQQKSNLETMLDMCDTFNFDGVAVAFDTPGTVGTYTLLVPRVQFKNFKETIKKDFTVTGESKKYGVFIKSFAFQDLKGNKYNAPDQLYKKEETMK